MTGATNLLVGQQRGNDGTFWGILGSLSLQTNCVLCVDAGDASSWSGSGQNLTDRSSTAANFFRGATNAATTDDPTSTGSGLTTYFTNDGGDHFGLAGANPTAFENMHKANATYTVIWVGGVEDTVNAPSYAVLFDTANTSTAGVNSGVGFTIMASSSISGGKGGGWVWNGLQVVAWTGVGTTAFLYTNTNGTFTNTFEFVGFTRDNTDANLIINNYEATAITSTYSSPSASAANHVAQLFKNLGDASNNRFMGAMVWSTKLSQANVKAIQQAIKAARGTTWTNA